MTDIKLFPKQMATLKTPATEILYGGAAGGGKSHLLRAASIAFSIEIPGLITYLFRRTFKELLSNHIYTSGGYLELLDDQLKNKLVRYNKSDYSFDFPNGSRIQLAHAQYPSDIYQYLGAQIHLLLVDESTRFTEEMIRVIRSRVRLGSLEVPPKYKGLFPRIIYASNPGGVGHRYFKKHFVDKGLAIYKAPKTEGGMFRQFVPALLEDNPVLMRNDPLYSERLQGLGDNDLVEAMLSGDWDMSDSAAVPGWDRDIHVKPQFVVPSGWKIRRGYDYGFSAPYAVLWYAEANGEEATLPDGSKFNPPKKSIIIIDEMYGADKNGDGLKEDPRFTAKKIYLRDRVYGRVKPGPADNAIWNKETGTSIAEKMSDEGVNWMPANKRPGSRIIGLGVLNSMVFEACQPIPEKPCFYVMSNCVNTAEQIPALEVDEKNVEDVNTELEDHIYDVVRYIVLHSSREVSTMRVVGL